MTKFVTTLMCHKIFNIVIMYKWRHNRIVIGALFIYLMNCEHHPWLIDPSAGRFLYVQMKGTHMKEAVIDEHNLSNNISILHEDNQCNTRNRIAIYPGTLPPVIVCPLPPPHQRNEIVEVFSEGWAAGSMGDMPLIVSLPAIDKMAQEQARTVAVEFIGKDTGTYSVTWLELARSRHHTFSAIYAMSEVCKYRCPELDACINASLWCDGYSHCPSGYDESISHCSFILQLPGQYLAALCAALLSGASLGVYFLLRVRRRKRSSALQRRLESLSSDTAVFGDKEVIC